MLKSVISQAKEAGIEKSIIDEAETTLESLGQRPNAVTMGLLHVSIDFSFFLSFFFPSLSLSPFICRVQTGLPTIAGDAVLFVHNGRQQLVIDNVAPSFTRASSLCWTLPEELECKQEAQRGH